MHTNVQELKFKFILSSLFFLSLGLFVSPTIVSLYHILLVIPTLFLFKEGLRFKLSKSSYALILLGVWAVTSTAINHNELIKPFKAYQDIKYYFFGVFCIATIGYFLDRATVSQKRIILNTLFITLIVGFFVGISKAWLGFHPFKMKFDDFGYRSGGFLNYMRYGYGSAFLFIIGLGVHLNKNSFKGLLNKKLFYSALFLCLCAIFTSKTRGALLAVLVGVPILYLKYKPRVSKFVIACGSIFVLIVVYISFFSNSKIRFLDINDGSNKKRLSQFYSAVKSVQEKPILGLGADQFSYHVTALKERHDIWSKNYSGHSHNIFLEHAANYGIPGLVLFLSFLILWAYELLTSRKKAHWVIFAYLSAFIISGQVELLFDNLNSHLLFFIYSFSQINLVRFKNNSL